MQRSADRRLVLALDTTGERCSAALLEQASGAILASREPVIGLGHAERLMGIVGDVLHEAGADHADLSRIAVAVGPGSFTGIRVGVSAARGLALALGIPAVGIGTLDALAEPHREGGGWLLAVQDARRGEFYVALFAPGGRQAGPARAIRQDALGTFLAEAGADGPLRLTGSGAHLAEAALGGAPSCRIVDGSGMPAIASIARLGARADAGTPARPLYLRSADAKPQIRPSLLAEPSGFQPAPILP